MEIWARAKINLGLSVLGRLGEYHQIHTLMAQIDWADHLKIYPAREGIDLVVSGTAPAGPENLAYRAAQLYLSAAEVKAGVKIELTKHIPAGAGLGGGSADAAAVLLALARLYPSALDLVDLAGQLGSDVPFFLAGGLAEARGRGTEITPAPFLALDLVVGWPGFALGTAAVYRGLGSADYGPELPVAEIYQALRAQQEPPYWNSLWAPASKLRPELSNLSQAMRELGLGGVLLSGSGSSVFGWARGPEEAAQVAQELSRVFKGVFRAARTFQPAE